MTIAQDRDRILELLDRAEPRMADAFREVVDQLRSERTFELLVQYVETGQRAAFLEHLSLLGSSLAAGLINETFIPAATYASNEVATARNVVVVFDVTHPVIVEAMRQLRLDLITNFTDEQIALVNQMLTEAAALGTNPTETARWIQPHLGLTPRQQEAVANYRRLLEAGSREALDRELRDARSDRSLLAAIRNKKPLKPEQIESMVERYRNRYLSYRAKVIAQTESLRGTNTALQATFQAAVADGTFAAADLVRTWFTASDERVRSSHAYMHGQERGLDQPFLSGAGNYLMHPGDPDAPAEDVVNCRCVVTTRVRPPA